MNIGMNALEGSGAVLIWCGRGAYSDDVQNVQKIKPQV